MRESTDVCSSCHKRPNFAAACIFVCILVWRHQAKHKYEIVASSKLKVTIECFDVWWQALIIKRGCISESWANGKRIQIISKNLCTWLLHLIEDRSICLPLKLFDASLARNNTSKVYNCLEHMNMFSKIITLHCR
jgi:hypothetical protein